MKRVIFACVHDAGRSQIAARLFNQIAAPQLAQAISAGTSPHRHLYTAVVEAMNEVGVDLSAAVPRRMTHVLAYEAHLLITMGCRRECPMVPGRRSEDWRVPSLKMEPIEKVRQVRDDLELRVRSLVTMEGWLP